MYWHPTVHFLLCYSQFSTESPQWPFLKKEMKSCHSSKPTSDFHCIRIKSKLLAIDKQGLPDLIPACISDSFPSPALSSWFIPFPLAEILLPQIFMWFSPLFGGFPGAQWYTCQCRRHRRLRFNPWVGKIPWRRKWQSTVVFLPGKSHRQRAVAHGVAKSWEWLSD